MVDDKKTGQFFAFAPEGLAVFEESDSVGGEGRRKKKEGRLGFYLKEERRGERKKNYLKRASLSLKCCK